MRMKREIYLRLGRGKVFEIDSEKGRGVHYGGQATRVQSVRKGGLQDGRRTQKKTQESQAIGLKGAFETPVSKESVKVRFVAQPTE